MNELEKSLRLEDIIDRSMIIHRDKIAIKKDDDIISYGELRTRALIVANYILENLQLQKTNILFEARREITSYILMLGILYSGNVFIPLN